MKKSLAHKKIKLSGTTPVRTKRKITVTAEKMDLETTEADPVPPGQLPCGYCGSLPGKKHQTGCAGDGDAERTEPLCHSKPREEWCDRDGPGGFMGHTCEGRATLEKRKAPYDCTHDTLEVIDIGNGVLWCSNCGGFHAPGQEWTIPSLAYYPVQDRDFWKDLNAKLTERISNYERILNMSQQAAGVTAPQIVTTAGSNIAVAPIVVSPGERT